jgi:hypothetical protein
MIMKAMLLSFVIGVTVSACASAALVLTPGDAIIGGEVVGAGFLQGRSGAGPGNSWPVAESPSDAINGFFGGSGEKYLNRGGQDTGMIITPTTGPSIVTSLTLWNANDVDGRRPTSFSLLGTNATILDGGEGFSHSLSLFTPIASGPTGLPVGTNNPRRPVVGPPYTEGLRSTVSFANDTAYTSYLLYFPTLANQFSWMQISEVALDGTVVPEPSTALLGFLGSVFLMRRRRQA